MQSVPADGPGHDLGPREVEDGSVPRQAPYPPAHQYSQPEHPAAAPDQPWYGAPAPAQPSYPPYQGNGQPSYPQESSGLPQSATPYVPAFLPWPGPAAAASPIAPAPGRPPGNIALGSAVSLVASSICGVGGAAIITVIAISLRAINSIFGDGSTSALATAAAGSGPGQDVSEAVVFGVLFIALAIALAWGAVSAITGTSTATAITAKVITAVVLLLAVTTIHPLFLLLMVAPVTAVIALLSPSSKDYIRRRMS